MIGEVDKLAVLATKGMLHINQVETYGEIIIKLT